MKPKHFLILAIVLLVIYLVSKLASGSETFATPQFYPEFTDSALVNHMYFSLVYNEQHEQADWVTYSVRPENLASSFERRNIFREDSMIESGSASNKDYYRSGYDRGHLVPAGDMSFDSIALEESFYYSNISPQLPGFNRGIWRSLETHVREQAEVYDSLIVFTGPVYTTTTGIIGENQVTIPTSFYKILIQFRDNSISTEAYLIPHLEGLKDFYNYTVSIDSIEVVTGLDFLHGLPDRIETRLEK